MLDPDAVLDKTVIFVNTRDKATALYEWLHERLQEKGIHFEDDKAVGYTVDMFTSSVEDKAKAYIMKEFRKPNSHIRILIATLAFGLGGMTCRNRL
jgi:superfamily II DNA helicase RecQ